VKRNSFLSGVLLVLALFVLIGDSAHAAQTKAAQTKTEQTKAAQKKEPSEDDKFLQSCNAGIAQQVEEALKSGANINVKADYGLTGLMFASAFHPDLEIVITLLENGAFINAENDFGVTVLMYAAWATTDPKIVDVLLKNGAKVDAKEEAGATPLIFASLNTSKNSNAILRLLLDKGTDVNQQIVPGEKRQRGYLADRKIDWELGQTPLILAAKYTQDPDSILLLLDRGADPHLRDKKDNRAIDYARKNKALAGTEALKRLEKVSRVKVIR
jgi:ankyrin repeat protein